MHSFIKYTFPYQLILTSAECGAAGPDFARLGDHDLGQDPDCHDDGECADPGQDIAVDKVIAIEDRDVALIRLSNDVKENDFVSSVCIQLRQKANNIKFE